MVGKMVDDVDWRRVVKGHGAKGRWHKVELKTLEDLIVIENVGWQNLPQPWLHIMFVVCAMVPHWQKMATF
jgi:hypothetical protein